MKKCSSTFHRLRTNVKRMLIVCIGLFACSAQADALEVPKHQGFVSDHANMLSSETKTRIEGDLRALEQADSTQIFILTIPSLEGEIIEEFAIKVFDVWKAGQKKLDNGVILIVAQKERKIRIEVGRGLEGKLTDLEAGRIIDLVMKPKFKEGDFNGGFVAGVSSLIQGTKGEFKAAGRNGIGSLDIERKPVFFKVMEMVAQKAENFMEFVIAASVLFCALPILKALNLITRRTVSMAAGAAILPVIAVSTVWHPGAASFAAWESLFALLFYMVVGGLSGALVSFVTLDSGRGSGGSSSSSSGWSSGSSSSSSGSSGGGGGSSGGGGASGDY